MLPLSLVSYANTIFSTKLAGTQNTEYVISKLWTELDKKVKVLNIRRLSKLMSESMTLHEKFLINASREVREEIKV